MCASGSLLVFLRLFLSEAPNLSIAMPAIKAVAGFIRESAARNYPATGGNGDVRSPQTEAGDGLVN
jgi:hypothetical protein